MRPGGEKRGNSTDRRRRREWFVTPDAGFGGDGRTVPCVHCRGTLDVNTVTADRIIPGGPYARWNIQPSCLPDNQSRSNRVDWIPPRLRTA